MTLENLRRIGRLKEHDPSAEEIERLLGERIVAECRAEARELVARVDRWIRAERPGLLSP